MDNSTHTEALSNHTFPTAANTKLTKLQFNIVSIITFSSLLPFFILVFGSDSLFLQAQLFGQVYLAIIISFLCGMHWNIGLTYKIVYLNISSSMLAFLPWLVILLHKLSLIPSVKMETIWISMLLNIFVISIIDNFYLQKIHNTKYLTIRSINTSIITLCLTIIILRDLTL